MKDEAPKYIWAKFDDFEIPGSEDTLHAAFWSDYPEIDGLHEYVRLDTIDTEALAEKLRAHVVDCFMIGAPPGSYELKRILDEALGGEGDEQ